ncbi:three-helix bundle dimerization domain-containing protein [Microbacterium sp. NPDC090007]|uniref:three-helix bundle dimerization domain-containing protein n=1 Tax=Microbacterium sp. NPDC090007 TaxID=3364204 RepID=UPI0037F63423
MTTEPADEESAISEIVERLEERFPQSSPETVRAAVEDARQHFSRAKVKDFVPLFIEREARARLERPLPPS